MEYIVLIEEPAWKYIGTGVMIIICLFIAILALILNIIWSKRKNKRFGIKQWIRTMSLVVIFTIGIVICISQIYYDVLYIYDYKFQNESTTIEYIDAAGRETRDVCRIYTSTGEYIVPSYNYSLKEYGELCGFIDMNFVGYECEIQYYQLSKFVKSIKMIE